MAAAAATIAASRVALVTGSTTGLGYGIARALASKGHSIILSGFGNPTEIKLCEEQIKRDFQVPCYHIHADLANESEIRYMCAEVIWKHPPGIDVLVNNAVNPLQAVENGGRTSQSTAGFQHVEDIDDFPIEVWDNMMAVMLRAPFLLTKYLLPGWGRIINIASTHAMVASEKKAGYCSAKHGLIGLTKVTALDTARSPITCNTINPGWLSTEIFWKQVKSLAEELNISQDDAKEPTLRGFFHATNGTPGGILTTWEGREKPKFRILEKHPTKELTTVEQVGEAVNFLCSPAADNMTGTSIVLDGGWRAV